MAFAKTTHGSSWFSVARLASAGPLVKLAVWGLGVVLVSAVIQVAASLVGFDFWILDKSAGSGVLIVVALSLLLGMLAIERRPMADYGIVAETGWRRRAGLGLLLGAGVYAAYIGLAWLAGVVYFQTDAFSASRAGKALLSAIPAGPIAVTQQIIFAGFLVSLLRDRHSRGLYV
jgi:hypothetical protein